MLSCVALKVFIKTYITNGKDFLKTSSVWQVTRSRPPGSERAIESLDRKLTLKNLVLQKLAGHRSQVGRMIRKYETEKMEIVYLVKHSNLSVKQSWVDQRPSFIRSRTVSASIETASGGPSPLAPGPLSHVNCMAVHQSTRQFHLVGTCLSSHSKVDTHHRGFRSRPKLIKLIMR